MRMLLAALAALLAFASSPAHASFTQDDRYFNSRVPTAAPVKAKVRKVTHRKMRHMRKVVSRPLSRPYDRLTLTVKDEQLKDRRETVQYSESEAATPAVRLFSGRPIGAPYRWCGFWLGKLLGMPARALWLARNWVHVGTATTKQAGAIVVWRHHVGKITAVRADGAIRVLSGNDGRAVRDRWRSARGVIAYRML